MTHPSSALLKQQPSRALRCRLVLIACLCVSALPTAEAQTNYLRLKSFGFAEFSTANPYAELLEGSDGRWYGTTAAGGGDNSGTVFAVNKDGSGLIVLHSLSGTDGQNPWAGLAEGDDGLLYGAAQDGGSGLAGTIFKLHKDGSGFTVLWNFNNLSNNDGANPHGGLVQGNDGALYGTTYWGGSNGLGTVFKINKDGTGFTLLKSFTGASGDGKNPEATLLKGSDGLFYGTTRTDGASDFGTIFKMDNNGSNYVRVWRFTSGADGRVAALMEGGDGFLYGTKQSGGSGGAGFVYKMGKDGSQYSVLRNFVSGGTDAQNPTDGLVQSSDGMLWGTTYYGGQGTAGTVFKLNTNGNSYSVAHSFAFGPNDGQNPSAALSKGSDGFLYGTTQAGGAMGGGVVFRANNGGGDFKILRHLSPFGGDGTNPNASLTQGEGGALYGTTSSGGSNYSGTVFRLNQDGSGYTLLREFAGGTNDGSSLYAPLRVGTDAALYGTAFAGGSNGSGVVFKLASDGSGYSVLRSFPGFGGDGRQPRAEILEGSDAALYGTTWSGGLSNVGTVFKLNKDGGSYQLLHSFSNGVGEENYPWGGLVEGSNHVLYGTTHFRWSGYGAIFRLNLDGSGYAVLRNFTGGPGDGAAPRGTLLLGSDGCLYGTTYVGGSNYSGTVFRVNLDGSGYGGLRSFSSSGGDGGKPLGQLVEGGDGALYGTTSSGGRYGFGTVFKLNKDGSGYAVLRSFSSNGEDGRNPVAGLVLGNDGAFYGTTLAGGNMALGTIFKLFSPAPPRFTSVASQPDGSCRWSLRGVAYPNYRIEASTDLSSWLTLTNLPNPNGLVEFTDGQAAGFSQRFYRAVWSP